MKMIHCMKCHDLFRLYAEPRSCKCGASHGRYLIDNHHAIADGPCVFMAIANEDMIRYLSSPLASFGKGIRAWIADPGHAWDGINCRHVDNIDDPCDPWVHPKDDPEVCHIGFERASKEYTDYWIGKL